jgi:hypothetical protein
VCARERERAKKCKKPNTHRQTDIEREREEEKCKKPNTHTQTDMKREREREAGHPLVRGCGGGRGGVDADRCALLAGCARGCGARTVEEAEGVELDGHDNVRSLVQSAHGLAVGQPHKVVAVDAHHLVPHLQPALGRPRPLVHLRWVGSDQVAILS